MVTARNDHDTATTVRHIGRRTADQKRNVEIAPLAITVIMTVFTLIAGVGAYFFKGWAENITYELRQFRLLAEKQLIDNATHNEWKNGMSKWRDGVDTRLKDLDNRMNTLPWSVRDRPRRTASSQTPSLQTTGGSK